MVTHVAFTTRAYAVLYFPDWLLVLETEYPVMTRMEVITGFAITEIHCSTPSPVLMLVRPSGGAEHPACN